MRPIPLTTLLTVVALGLTGGACPSDDDVDNSGPQPIDPSKYAVYFTRYPFGGQPIEWWNNRLAELAPGGAHADPVVYALTLERAKKNGLVTEEVNGKTYVKPGPELSAILIKRLEVK